MSRRLIPLSKKEEALCKRIKSRIETGVMRKTFDIKSFVDLTNIGDVLEKTRTFVNLELKGLISIDTITETFTLTKIFIKEFIDK